MNEEFENQLRRALRPVEAPEGFAERLLQKLPPKVDVKPGESPTLVALASPPRRSRNFTLPAALAASLVVAVLLGQQISTQRLAREEAEGRAASLEILQALRVTSQKLDLAYEAVNSPPANDARTDAEENPS